MNNNNVVGEIDLVCNFVGKHKIHIYRYSPFVENRDAEYILRRSKDRKLICKLDKQLNIIGAIENMVLMSELEKAYDRIKTYEEVTGWVDDYFDNI